MTMCGRNDLMHDANPARESNQTPVPAVRLFIPGVPMSANEWSRHWRTRHSERNRWRDLVRIAVLQATPRPESVPGPYSATLTFYFPDRTRRDPDNATKLVLDGVKLAGLVRDDGPPYLTELVLRPRLAPDARSVGVLVQLQPEGAAAWPIPVRRNVPRETCQNGMALAVNHRGAK